MGQKAEENDGQTIAENVMENILNKVTRSINERTDSCFDSFESLKLQTFGNEDILDYGCSRRETRDKYKEPERQDNVNADFHVDDLCYPSLANLPEVCVHSSTLSKTSKQGEGDFQHQNIREAVTFYRLETEENVSLPSGSKAHGTSCESCSIVDNLDSDTDQLTYSPAPVKELEFTEGSKECKNSCASSCTTEFSTERLIEDLQRTINDVSFNSVHLSDDSDDGSQEPLRSPMEACLRDEQTWEHACACLFDDQCSYETISPDNQTYLHQSRKFCQINNVHYFPHEEIPPNYCQLVDESYKRYESIAKEEYEEKSLVLSDGSSEELVIIESDEIEGMVAEDCYSQANNFQNSFPCSSKTPSTMLFNQFPNCTPGTSAEPTDNRNRITVVADVEPTRDHRNWEEAQEIQVNVTEPIRLTELDDSDEMYSRKYWTTVGLITEKSVDPKLISDDTNGIESVPGMLRVQETRLTRDHRRHEEDEIMTYDEVTKRETIDKLSRNFRGHGRIEFEQDFRQTDKICDEHYSVELDNSEENLSDEDKVNYLNVSEGAARSGKKKNKFVSRLTKSFSNLFRLKKKNPK